MKRKFFYLVSLFCIFCIRTGHAAESRTLYSESFLSGKGGFTISNRKMPSSLTYIWKHDSKYGMVATAYLNGKSYESESWLISPTVNLSRCSSAYCTYMHAAKFQNGEENRGVTVWAAENPTTTEIIESEWTQLDVPAYPAKGTWNFSSTGQISIHNLAGKDNVRIAIRYNSTNTAADTYEMKSFEVVGVIGETFTITAQPNDPNMGSVSGGGVYVEGAEATLVATPKEGYNFKEWSDGNTSATRVVKVYSNRTYIAKFSEAKHISIAEAKEIERGLLTARSTEDCYYISGKVCKALVDTTNMTSSFILCEGLDSIKVLDAKGLGGAACRFYGQIQDGDTVSLITKIFSNYWWMYDSEQYSTLIDILIANGVGFYTNNHQDYITPEIRIYDSYYNEVYRKWSDAFDNGDEERMNELEEILDEMNRQKKDGGEWRTENGRSFYSKRSATPYLRGYLTYQNNQYVNTGGLVYKVTPQNEVIVTNHFNSKEDVLIRDSLEIDNKQIPVSSIMSNAFNGIKSKRVLIPSTIKRIEASVFKDCPNLETVISLSNDPPQAKSTSFEGISNFICTLYVPQESVEKYKNAVGWKYFKYIEPLKTCILSVDFDKEKGNVIGVGNYKIGEKVTITAIPNTGYRFIGWSNGITNNPYILTILDDFSLSALFEVDPLNNINTIKSLTIPTHTRKVVRNGQVFIEHGDKTYNINGLEVK